MKAAPVTRTAGARHSARAPHPSARMRDPDNAESSILAGQKRSRKESPPTRHTSRKVIHSDSDHDHDVPAATFADGETEPEDMEPEVIDDYEKLKSMADADHEVRTFTPIHPHYLPVSGNELLIKE